MQTGMVQLEHNSLMALICLLPGPAIGPISALLHQHLRKNLGNALLCQCTGVVWTKLYTKPVPRDVRTVARVLPAGAPSSPMSSMQVRSTDRFRRASWETCLSVHDSWPTSRPPSRRSPQNLTSRPFMRPRSCFLSRAPL